MSHRFKYQQIESMGLRKLAKCVESCAKQEHHGIITCPWHTILCSKALPGCMFVVRWQQYQHKQFKAMLLHRESHLKGVLYQHIDPWEIWQWIFQTHLINRFLKHFLWNWTPSNTTDDVSVGSGNCLVLSGNKPLPESMLAQIYVAIWCH